MFRGTFALAALASAGCAPAAPPPDAPAPAARAPSRGEDEKLIAGVLDDWHDAAAKADEARYFGYLAEDSVFLGTDATERWDKKAFRAYAHPHFEKGKAWSMRAVRRAVVLGPGGDTAWFDEDLETARLGPARGSGALVRTAEGWRITQYNLSIPIPNERFDAVKKIIAGEEPAPTDPAAAPGACGDRVYKGRVCGLVTFDGTPPVMAPPPKRKDAEWCKLQPLPHDAVMAPSGRLADVAIRVVSGVKDPEAGRATEVVIVRQQLCMYSPRVVGAAVGQTLSIQNEGETLHNVHAYGPGGDSWFNQAQPKGSPPVQKELEEAGILRLTDDVHPWMFGFVVVSPHRYFDVTDQTGRFSIDGLPPGTYGIEAWHSIYGTKKATAVVKEDEGAKISFEYNGKEALAKENPQARAELKSFR